MDTVRTMTGTFALATSVRRRETSGGDGPPDGRQGGSAVFDAEIKPGWDINGNANGGYLMAIAGRAMAETAGRPPLTLTAHYLKPAPAGPCEVEVNMVRAGRRLATATGSLRMGDTEIIRLLGTFGEQTPGGPAYTREEPVDLPSYEDSAVPPPPTEGPKPAMFERLRIRLRPEDVGFRTGHPTGRGQDRRLVRVRRRGTGRRHRSPARGRRVPACGVQHRTAGGVGADGRADGARARRSGARPTALFVRVALHPRRPARRGGRDLGFLRRPRRPVPPTGARPPPDLNPSD